MFTIYYPKYLLPPIILTSKDQIAIFTANGESLKPMMDLVRKESGVTIEDNRFVRVGLEDIPGFD